MTPLEAAHVLGTYAQHFEVSDWNYTRDLGTLKKIVYGKPKEFRERLRSSFEWATGKHDDILGLLGTKSAYHRLQMIRYTLIKGDGDNLPDGSLDGGSILTFWEETGEYLQMVQPSVGLLIAEFLLEEPENPHAKKIASEIGRILKSYEDRLDKEKANG